MVQSDDVIALTSRLNELTKRLSILEEQLATSQERLEDLMRSTMKKSTEMDKGLNGLYASFSSVVKDLLLVKTDIKSIKKELVKFAPSSKVEELEGFINMFSPMEAVTREEVRKIVQEMMRGGTA